MRLRQVENDFNSFNVEPNVEPFCRDIFQGLIILLAVALDALRHRRS